MRIPRRFWKRLAQAAATVVVTVFIFRQVGVTWQSVTTLNPERWTPHPLWLTLSVATLGFGYVVSGLLWGRMGRELGGPTLSARRSTGIYMTANLGRYVPGKVWQIVGLTLLARDAAVPPALAAGAAVLGQVTALAGASLVGSVALLRPPLGAAAALAGAWTAAVLVVVAVPQVFGRVLAMASRVAGPEAAVVEAPSPSFGIRWVGLYAANWILYALAFWALARSFGLPGGPITVGSSFAAAYVLGYLALFAPAGIGIREGFLVAFLDPIMGARAVGLAIVARLWTTAVEVVTALAAGSGTRPAERRGEEPR
jgi:uncharacterized membrane protein YbhN (UPF0104 family)